MNNNYFPAILKDKLTQSFSWMKGSFFLILSVFLFIAILTFDINDNSFLTQTNSPPSNVVGPIGSYAASFLVYSFGLLSYLIVIFLLISSYAAFWRKNFGYFFIRLFLILVSIVLIPQSLFYWGWDIEFYSTLNSWGEISYELYTVHQSEWISYSTSFAGVLLFLIVQNIFSFIKFPKFNSNLFKQKKDGNIQDLKIKKEPFIANKLNIEQKIQQTTEKEKENSKTNNSYYAPSLNILDSESDGSQKKKNQFNLQERSELLEKVFADFNIQISVVNIKLGPVVTLYEILPAAGIKINTIINLADDISRSMGVGAVRIAQIFGTQYLGVEVPNDQRESVTIKELLSDQNFKSTTHKIPICIGKDISGNIEVIDLSKTPHLLVAGTTGSGKSVFINTLLASLLYKFSPSELRLILIDPKMLELSVYNDIAHLLTPFVTEPK